MNDVTFVAPENDFAAQAIVDMLTILAMRNDILISKEEYSDLKNSIIPKELKIEDAENGGYIIYIKEITNENNK